MVAALIRSRLHLFTDGFYYPNICKRAIFKSYLHTSPINYALEYRLKRAAKFLTETENSVFVIAQTAGFENVGYFCRKFKALYGMTPKEYRNHRRSERK